MCPETASKRQLMTVPWLWSVLVSSQSSHFSQCPPSPHSQPVIIQPGPSPQPGQWSHLCKSDPSSDEPLSDPRQRIQWCEPAWWWEMGDHPPHKRLAVKCAPIQILTLRRPRAVSWNIELICLSWFLFTVCVCVPCLSGPWGLMSVLFDPDLHIPSSQPSISRSSLYCYRVYSSWQKSVSSRDKCFRKTNEANVNFFPVFQSKQCTRSTEKSS